MSIKSDAIISNLQALRSEWDTEAQEHTPMGPGGLRERLDDAVSHLDAIIIHLQAEETNLATTRLALMEITMAAIVLRRIHDAGPGN